MKTKIYKFHIQYEGLERQIYRDVELSSDTSLCELGYLVFATFDVLGIHGFTFSFRSVNYRSLPEWAEAKMDGPDPREVKLSEMHLVRGSVIYVFYDLARDHTFICRFLGAATRDEAIKYPRITDGRGLGIIEEVSPSELARRVRRINRLGASDELYRRLDSDTYVRWDVGAYDIDNDNERLDSRIALFSERYSNK